jgi:cardiolipin synthase
LTALLADIDGASERVHLLYYLLFDDAVGEAVCQSLERAAARGVQCRLLLDAVGAKRGLRCYARRLRKAGVEVHVMLPGGLRWRRSGRMDLRNHRKVAVIDSSAGYVGSQNLAAPDFVRGFPNRELVARVQGPVVAHLEGVFASDWYIETGRRLQVKPVPAVSEANVAMQLLPSGPAYPFENARDTVNALIHLAQRKIVLTTPYFVPDDATLSALRIAALSGVEVQLILSASNNQRLTAWAQDSYYDELLASGVKIALYRPHFLHAKHLSVDEDIPGGFDQPGHTFFRVERGNRIALLRPRRGRAHAASGVGVSGGRRKDRPRELEQTSGLEAQPRRHRAPGRFVDVGPLTMKGTTPGFAGHPLQ